MIKLNLPVTVVLVFLIWLVAAGQVELAHELLLMVGRVLNALMLVLIEILTAFTEAFAP